MAINSTHHGDSSAISQEPRLIDLRFSLRRLMARTALVDIFWANDLHGATENMPEKNVLLLLVNPALVRLSNFTNAWQQVLGRPAPPAPAYPDIITYGEHEGVYWLALNNVSGMLLSERIGELDERGIPLNTALDTLHNIHQTLDSVQAGAYGYIEPGVLQYTERGSYKILNAPLVKVMQLLTSARKGTINQLALHSAYLSPSVSVGDVPVTEDDTFSTASLLYTMLSGKPPFGEQSTLTAVAHGDTPLPLNKLKKQSWEAVEQALTYQRSARPENPEKFLALLKKSSRKKVLFPLAALAALGVTVFAGQHLVGRLGDYMSTGDGLVSGNQQAAHNGGLLSNPSNSADVPSTQPNQPGQPTAQISNSANTANNNAVNATNRQNTATTAQNNNQQSMQPEQSATNTNTNTSELAGRALQNTAQDIDQASTTVETRITPNNAAANAGISSSSSTTNNGNNTAVTAAATATAANTNNTQQNNAQQQQGINQLLRQAATTLNKGQLEDSDSGKQGAISLLRELATIDNNNPDVSALMSKVVDKKYQLAERRLGAKKFEEAEILVQDSDRLIREFMLTDKLQRQVKMESKVSILRKEQDQVNDLLRDARTAISLGTLSQRDGEDHALSYLRQVLFKQPGNAEAGKLLTEIVSLRQQDTYRALNNRDLIQARNYLRESDRLIKKYRLRGLRADQQAVAARYDALANSPTTTRIGGVQVIDLTPQQTSQRQQQQQAETEATRQRRLQQQANAEAEAARQRQLQQQAAAEITRQRQLQQQANAAAEAARQRQLQQQAQQAQTLARQRQQQQAQAEAARQRQFQQQQAARQRQLQQQAAARQQQQAAARQRQLQQQATQTVDGFIVDENGFVIGEPPLVDDFVDGTLNDNGAGVVAIPVQRLQPNAIGIQAIDPTIAGGAQAVPVWEGNNLQQIQPAGAAVNVQAQFDNFQSQANAVNVPFPGEEEVIPELQEVPLSVIEGVLPRQ